MSMSMLSTKRERPCVGANNGMVIEPMPIPLDLRLEVLSRLDFRSLLRYAAACKSARRDILGQDFRRSLAHRAAASRGFDPTLFLGFSYRLPMRGMTAADRVAQTCGQQYLRFDASLLDSLDPVTSRDSLVVLLRRPANQRWFNALSGVDLRVCNSLTGQTFYLPPADVHVAYPHALLAVGDSGRSFQLLAVDADLRTQTFSSEHGRWGAVVEPRHAVPYATPIGISHAMVLGGTAVYWLSWIHPVQVATQLHPQPRNSDPISIVSLSLDDAGSSQLATRIDLPPGFLDRLRSCQPTCDGLMLAPSPDGARLSILAAETCVISLWTLSGNSSLASTSSARWTRQVVIRRNAIEQQPGPEYFYSVRFMRVGERSGVVILQMDGIGLVQLNLGSKEAVVVSRDESFKRILVHNLGGFPLCLHEIHLTARLQAMKPF